MQKVKAAFDDFIIEARVMPAVTIVMPVLAVGLHRGILNSEWTEASVEFALALVMLMFMACVARECGKTYEKKMFGKLNAMPTTILMRFSDDTIDVISKIKYHRWFNDREENYNLPLSLEEEQADVQSDSKYISAINALRVYANEQRTRFPRVYQELKKYNYWRNLYGCKKLAIILYMLMVLKECTQIEQFHIRDIAGGLSSQYNVLLGIILWTVLYCMTVTKKVVERNAFDYARTLIETICVTGIR